MQNIYPLSYKVFNLDSAVGVVARVIKLMKIHTKVLGIYGITGITIAGILTPRTLPIMAKYGFASTFFYIIAALLFFIPTALACAELATGWPQKGGSYAWVSAAFGSGTGFLTVWLEWVNNVAAFPMNLVFLTTALAYIFDPSLAQNKAYLVTLMLVIFWGVTLLNLFGI